MSDANDFVHALNFIAREAKTPKEAMHMVAVMIDGGAGWTDLTPLDVKTTDGHSLTTLDGNDVLLHEILGITEKGTDQ